MNIKVYPCDHALSTEERQQLARKVHDLLVEDFDVRPTGVEVVTEHLAGYTPSVDEMPSWAIPADDDPD